MKTILKFFLFFFCSALIFAQINYEPDIIIESPRSTALGGFHAAYADDFDVLFSNPALYRKAGNRMRFSQLTLGLHGPVFDITNLVLEAMDGTDFEVLLEEEENLALMTSLYASADLTGPISFAFLGDGIGFGFFNSSSLTFETPSTLEITATLSEELLLLGGYSFNLPIHIQNHSFESGATLKGFFRSEGGFGTSVVLLTDVIEDFSQDLFLEQPYDVISGIGLDLGFLYTYKNTLSFGLGFQDLYTPTIRSKYSTMQSFLDGEDSDSQIYGIIPMKVNTGLSYHPQLGRLKDYISDFTFSLDYRNALDFIMYPDIAVNPLLHISTGMEFVILDVLSLRSGFREGLFSAGLGVQLGIVDIGLSMYGRERGIEPGLKPVYNVMFGVDIER